MAGIRPKLQGPSEDFRDFIIKDEAENGFPGDLSILSASNLRVLPPHYPSQKWSLRWLNNFLAKYVVEKLNVKQ